MHSLGCLGQGRDTPLSLYLAKQISGGEFQGVSSPTGNLLQDALRTPPSCSVLVSSTLLHKKGFNMPRGYPAYSPKAASDQEKEGKENNIDQNFLSLSQTPLSSVSGLDGKLH